MWERSLSLEQELGSHAQLVPLQLALQHLSSLLLLPVVSPAAIPKKSHLVHGSQGQDGTRHSVV